MRLRLLMAGPLTFCFRLYFGYTDQALSPLTVMLI
ncbi:UNVERIFIED_ORG: hypothetical protein M2414_003935 [Rahnella aquatilis]